MFSAEQLLLPISDEQPAGVDLSFSPELDAITLARKFDDPSLDQGEWVADLKEADWDFVVRAAPACLPSSSKDLRLAVWLTEAGAKRHRCAAWAKACACWPACANSSGTGACIRRPTTTTTSSASAT